MAVDDNGIEVLKKAGFDESGNKSEYSILVRVVNADEIGGGGTLLTIYDEGVEAASAVNTIDFVGPLVQASGTSPNDATVTINLDNVTTDDLNEGGSNVYFTNQRVLDVVATLTTDDLTEGSNLYFTDERAQDAVGGILTDSSTVDFTYDDASNQITASVIASGITHNNLSGLTSGDPHTQYAVASGIGLTTDNSVVRMNGTSGRSIKNSLVIIDNSNNISTPGSYTGSASITSVGASANIVAGGALRAGPSTDTTSGNIVYNHAGNNEMTAIINGTRRVVGLLPTEATSETTVSTSSGTFASITGMTITPIAGQYEVQFTCSASAQFGTDSGQIALYVQTNQNANSVRTIASVGCAHTAALLTVNGSQTIAAAFRATAGTLTVTNRRLRIMPVGRAI